MDNEIINPSLKKGDTNFRENTETKEKNRRRITKNKLLSVLSFLSSLNLLFNISPRNKVINTKTPPKIRSFDVMS